MVFLLYLFSVMRYPYTGRSVLGSIAKPSHAAARVPCKYLELEVRFLLNYVSFSYLLNVFMSLMLI